MTQKEAEQLESGDWIEIYKRSHYKIELGPYKLYSNHSGELCLKNSNNTQKEADYYIRRIGHTDKDVYKVARKITDLKQVKTLKLLYT